MRVRSRFRGFTLVELLVVIAIIGVMVGLLLPAVQAAREAARRMSCSNNLKQLALAMHNYHDSFKVFPAGHRYIGAFNGNPNNNHGGTGFGWGFALLPYIEQQPLFEQFNPGLPIGQPPNVGLATTPLDTFSCPSDVKPPNWNDQAIPDSATSSYQGAGSSYNGWTGNAATGNANPLRWNGTFERDNRPVYRMRDLLDGTSNTVVIAETKWQMDNNRRNRSRIYGASANANWAQGASNALMINGEWAINWTALEGNPNPHRTAGSEHPGGAQFAFGDGSVRFISENIEHTATAWINNANAFMTPDGVPYGVYQRLFSVADKLPMPGEF